MRNIPQGEHPRQLQGSIHGEDLFHRRAQHRQNLNQVPLPDRNRAVRKVWPTRHRRTSAPCRSSPGQEAGDQTVTLKNVGSVAVQITRIHSSTQFAQTHTCGTSLAAGASCDVMVTFTPNATGLQRSLLSITGTGGASPQTVPLSGTGS